MTEKKVVVWIHDIQFSEYDLVVNANLFKNLKTRDVKTLFIYFFEKFNFFFFWFFS